MAKIVYNEGCEGQNKLSCIKGIEIELLNGQKALIFPKYAEKQMLKSEYISMWRAKNETEIEALQVKDTYNKTLTLNSLDSPAADWVTCFRCQDYGQFYLPSLLAAIEIQYQKVEIDSLAETIEGADLLRDFTSLIWSCSRFSSVSCWFAYGGSICAVDYYLYDSGLTVPTKLFSKSWEE